FTEAQVARAHQKGIPVVVSYKKNLSISSSLDIGTGNIALYFKMQDTCGNAIEVRFYNVNDRDENLEYFYNKTTHYSEATDDDEKRSDQFSEYDSESKFSKWSSVEDDGTALLKIRRAGPCLP
ncbi:MAG: hypothetical protein AAF934_03335, partial [Bacteroidota bacterium]